MSLLIIQTQNPDQTLAADSYGVIATAAMLDQDVSVAYYGHGVKQLKDSALSEQLSMARDFGVKAVYVSVADCERFNVKRDSLNTSIEPFKPEDLGNLIDQNDKVLIF